MQNVAFAGLTIDDECPSPSGYTVATIQIRVECGLKGASKHSAERQDRSYSEYAILFECPVRAR